MRRTFVSLPFLYTVLLNIFATLLIRAYALTVTDVVEKIVDKLMHTIKVLHFWSSIYIKPNSRFPIPLIQNTADFCVVKWYFPNGKIIHALVRKAL